MESVSLEKVYAKLTEMEREIKIVRTALIPEEKVSKEELEEIKKIDREMQKGERISLNEFLDKKDV